VLLIIWGITNPFCCCSASIFSADSPKSEIPASTCCAQTDTTVPVAPGSESKDCQDCPHKAAEWNQITDYQQGAMASLARLAMAPVNQAFKSDSSEKYQDAVSVDFTAATVIWRPLIFSQVNCIYIL
jgi:hypothetical protein